MTMDLNALKIPFPAADIEWRIQQGGMKGDKPWAMVLAYVTNRAIMERLDEVCGPENWMNQFSALPDGGITCGIGIRINNEWIWKWDGADKTNIEATKGGLSGAMKRAGVQWGIGRYLYNLDGGWAVFSENGQHKSKIDNKWFRWDAPQLPAWALPGKLVPKAAPKAPPQELELASPAQVQKIQILSTELGLKDREAKIARVNKWLQDKGATPITTTKELTKSDASALIEAMTEAKRRAA
jgi:hypothetical protein